MLNDKNIHLIAIKDHYEGQKANRTGIPYINHIMEGLYILKELKTTREAKQAYCLHPIYQVLKNPEESEIYKKYGHSFNSYSVFLAKEYAKTANAYLSRSDISKDDVIELSPYWEVNDMLIADKVQNRKDFELNYQNQKDKIVFDRSEQLSQYFKNWIKTLGLTEEQYFKYKKLLVEKEGEILG